MQEEHILRRMNDICMEIFYLYVYFQYVTMFKWD